MPAGLPFIVYATGTAISVAAAVLKIAALGYAIVVPGLEARKARKAAAADRRDLMVTLQSAIEPHRLVYGRARISGPLVYATSEGPDHVFLHRVIALTGHEIHAYEAIYFNDTELNLGAIFPALTNFSQPVQGGRYVTGAGPTAHIEGWMGTATQPASVPLITASAGQWTSDHRLLGRAYLRVQTNYDPNVYTEGVPNVTARILGARIYDPRTATTAWSDNAALVIRDYLTRVLGVPAARLDDASFIAAANVCDEYVTIDTSTLDTAAWNAYLATTLPWALWENTGTNQYRQRKYRANGVITSDSAPGEVLDQLVRSCAGWLSYTGGVWRLVAGGYTAPTLTLGVNDLRGPASFRQRPGRRDLYNVAKGTYSGPTTNFIATDFAPLKSASFLAEDGGTEMPLDLDMPFTNEAVACQRVASIMLQRSRQGVLNFPATLTGLALRPGDTVAVTLPHFGFSSKVFRVEGWSLSDDLGVDLVLREDAAGIYTWTPSNASLVDPAPDLNLPNPWSVPAVAGLTAASGAAHVIVQPDGTVIQRVRLSWTVTANSFQRYIEIESSSDGGLTWLQHPNAADDEGFTYLTGLRSGISYQIRARRLNTVGSRGDWTTISHTPTAVWPGSNLLRNSDFTEDNGFGGAYVTYIDARALNGWTASVSAGMTAGIGRNHANGTAWNIGRGGAWMFDSAPVAGGYYLIEQRVPVGVGVAYEASAYVSAHRCECRLLLNWYDAAGAYISTAATDTIDAGTGIIGTSTDPVGTHKRLWVLGTAPAGAITAGIQLYKTSTTAGQSDSYAYWSRSLLCVAPPNVTEETATPWIGDAGVVVGGMVQTLAVADGTVLGRTGTFFDWTSIYTKVATISHTPARDCKAILSATGILKYAVTDTAGKTDGTTQTNLGFVIATPAEQSSGVLGTGGAGRVVTVVTEAPGEAGMFCDHTREFTLTGGIAYTFDMWGQKVPQFPTTRTSKLDSGRFSLTIAPIGATISAAALAFSEAQTDQFADQLADSGGSNLVGFIRSETGAVARTVLETLRDTAVNVKDFGAIGNGSTDDTTFIQAAIDSLTGGGTVYFPRGTYKTTATLTVSTTAVYLRGDGPRASIILFAPTANDTCVEFSDGSSVLFQTGIFDMSLFSNDSTYTKVGVDVVDVSGFFIDNVVIHGGVTVGSVIYWSGSNSVGIRVRGRECSNLSRVLSVADRPLLIAANPNSGSISLDHFTFTDFHLVANAHPCVEVESGLALTQITFDGYQAWVAGTDGFSWVDTTSTGTSNGLTLCNARVEQGTSSTAHIVRIEHNQTLQNVRIIGGQGGDRNGFKFRDCENVRIENFYYTGGSGKTAMDVDGTVNGLSFASCFWQAASSATMTGQRLVWRSPLYPNTGPLAPNAIYDLSANAARGFFIGDAISEEPVTVANDGIAALSANNGMQGLLLLSSNDGNSAIFQMHGSNQNVTEVSDTQGVFSTTAGTAAMTNIYWSAGNARYELENKRGSSKTYKALLVGSYSAF